MIRSLRWLPVVPLLLVLLVSAGCAKSPSDRAQEFLDAGMASQAAPLLQIEIQSNPKNARAHLMLGQAQLMLSDQAAAKESFDRAVLLNPRWADEVGRAYLDAANRVIAADPSAVSLTVSYLEAARQRTPTLDTDIARLFGRLGVQAQSPQILRRAVELDAKLAEKDSIALLLAADPDQSPETQKRRVEQFLGAFPASGLRPNGLFALARIEAIAGNASKAKAYAEEAARATQDESIQSAARSLLEDLDSVARSEQVATATLQDAQNEAAHQALMARQADAKARADAAAFEARRQAENLEAQRELARWGFVVDGRVVEWEGMITQGGSNYTVVVRIRSLGLYSEAEATYPTLGCPCTWKLQSKDAGHLEFTEYVRGGPCLPGGVARLTRNPDGTIACAILVDGSVCCTGTLRPR